MSDAIDDPTGSGPATVRRRSHEWVPLTADSISPSSMRGIDFLTRLITGEIPAAPISRTIGWQLDEAEIGRVQLSLQPEEFLMHGGNLVHGGVLTTLLDSASANAVISHLAPGFTCVTLQMNTHFLRPVTENTGRIVAIGETIHCGRRSATATASITDGTGRLFAQASSTYLIMEVPKAPPE